MRSKLLYTLLTLFTLTIRGGRTDINFVWNLVASPELRFPVTGLTIYSRTYR